MLLNLVGLRFFDGFDLELLVIVLAEMVVVIEAVVVLLGVEVDECGFHVFVLSAGLHSDRPKNEEPFEELLEILNLDLQVEVVEEALVDELLLEDVLDHASSLHYDVRLS